MGRSMFEGQAVRSRLRRLIDPAAWHNSYRAWRRHVVVVDWWTGHANWGDGYNVDLFEHLTGRKVVSLDEVAVHLGAPVWVGTGSVLGLVRSRNARVWGAGFIQASDAPRPALASARFHAVRGPRTAALLRRAGLPAPTTFGDPGVLADAVYGARAQPPSSGVRFCLIPHYVDMASPEVAAFVERHPDVEVVDVTGDRVGIVDRVSRCTAVASSSLHGLILADALGVPSCRVRITESLTGGDFKFEDYFLGSDQPIKEPVLLRATTTVGDLLTRASVEDVTPVRDRLLEALPDIP